MQTTNNLSDVSSISQAGVNLGVMPLSGGTFTGAVTATTLTDKYFQEGTTGYNYSGAMTASTLPIYSNVYLTGAPTAGPTGQIAPWEFLLTDSPTNLSSFPAGVDAMHVKAAFAAGATGSLQAIVGQVVQNGTPASSSYTNIYNAGQFLAIGNYNNGGTSTSFTTYKGSLFGANPQVIGYSGATYFALMNAQENDIAVEATSAPPAEKYGQTIVQTAGDAVRGLFGDAALGIANQANAATTWLHGVQFGTVQGKWAFGADSTLIGAFVQSQGCGSSCPTISPVANYGVDFSAVVFTSGGGAFKSTGFLVDPSGNVSGASLTATGLLSAAYLATNASGQIVAAAAPATGVSSFNNRTGAVTPISGDVTGALGFTPYNATNPSGYVTATTAPVTSVDTLTGAVVTEHCDTYSASGTWTKLANMTQVTVELIGGGGGGGKGGTDPGSSATTGGAGGGGGFHKRFSGPASAFTSGISVTIGAGGAGSTGSNSTAGGTTTFAGRIAPGGGGGGDGASGGVAAASGAGAGVGASGGSASGSTPGTGFSAGQAGSATATLPLTVPGQPTAGAPGLAAAGGGTPNPTTNDAPTGGSSGGGITAAGVASGGANSVGPDAVPGAPGGANTGAVGGAGVLANGFVGSGGGGGGGNASGAGGSGGAGVNGGGGGGGGAGTTSGGAGGAGGGGLALVCQRVTG